MDTTYNQLLIAALTGRRSTVSQLSVMGEALGFPEGDVHFNRFYRVFFTLGPDHVITEAAVKVDGDLISPCSGYFPEVLDRFDYDPLLQWCLDAITG